MRGSYCSVQCCNGPDTDLKHSERGLMLSASWDFPDTYSVWKIQSAQNGSLMREVRGEWKDVMCGVMSLPKAEMDELQQQPSYLAVL